MIAGAAVLDVDEIIQNRRVALRFFTREEREEDRLAYVERGGQNETAPLIGRMNIERDFALCRIERSVRSLAGVVLVPKPEVPQGTPDQTSPHRERADQRLACRDREDPFDVAGVLRIDPKRRVPQTRAHA